LRYVPGSETLRSVNGPLYSVDLRDPVQRYDSAMTAAVGGSLASEGQRACERLSDDAGRAQLTLTKVYVRESGVELYREQGAHCNADVKPQLTCANVQDNPHPHARLNPSWLPVTSIKRCSRSSLNFTWIIVDLLMHQIVQSLSVCLLRLTGHRRKLSEDAKRPIVRRCDIGARSKIRRVKV